MKAERKEKYIVVDQLDGSITIYQVEKKPILYTDYYDVNKFKEACEFNVVEDNQIANLEIDRNSKDFKDDPIYFLRYKEYERYTQLCNGLLAYY